ncbi:MAG: ABC transporter permease [Ruminococcus sp.]|nr:ABC transporter permease [Ruminococcus sp.]
MKFINLLKKELKELINAQMIASLLVVMALLVAMGNMMSSTINEISNTEYKVSLSDRDDTDFTKSLLDQLEKDGSVITLIKTEGDNYSEILKENNLDSIIIIPEGFTDLINKNEKPELITVSRMESAAMMSNISNHTSDVTNLINTYIYKELSKKAGITEEELNYMTSPVNIVENTVVADKSANISVETIMNNVMMKNQILPIVVFILITMVSQTIMNAIANEKIDKTLETLLSAPVSRSSIIGAKMLAAAIVAMLNAAFYMVGFSSFMSKTTNSTNLSSNMDSLKEMAEGASSVGDILSTEAKLSQLGLSLGITDYLLVGLQLFITIMICLSVSIILGALVNDTKSSQTMIMPLLMLAMIPYMISIFADINSLPVVFKTLVYAIPFTHTFSAMSNLMFGHYSLFFGGIIYQIIVLAVCMFFALRLFNSDKILTISLNFGKKDKQKTNSDT